MNTKSINKKRTAIKIQAENQVPATTISTANEYTDLSVDRIALSPFNYRKLFSEKDLQDFATEIAQHGIISPLTVRLLPSGNYELVAGERRLRAAAIGGLATVPVVINQYSDEQVIEIQLSENLQRENPHPLHEAFAIAQMQDAGKIIDEIAARLGKSKPFIYTRIKLLSLIEPVQEMFLHDAINLMEASAIAGISPESQTEFFQVHCRDWKKRKNFELTNLEHKLDQFTYDLKKAPFSTRDKKLLPAAGACTDCPSNTATLKTLFPDLARQAICNNRECYHKKCSAYFTIAFANALSAQAPDGLIFNGEPSELITDIIKSVKGAGDLPTYNLYDIDTINPPELPGTDEYTNDDEQDEENRFDEKGFTEAMEEYEEEMGQYNLLMQSGKLQKGLLVTENNIRVLTFNPEKQIRPSAGQTPTAKDVQAAIKTGTATAILLQSEIDRLNNKETRSQQLDREKVQLAVHEQFCSEIAALSNNHALTNADQTAARLLIYQSLDYHSRSRIDAALFPASADDVHVGNNHFYQQLADLSDCQYSWLIRTALACKADSKFPNNTTGLVLYKLAESAGINTEEIEHGQEQKATARQAKQLEKINDLQKQICKLQSKQ